MEEEQDLLVVYNIQEKTFTFSDRMKEVFSANLGRRSPEDVISHEIFLSNGDKETFIKKFKKTRDSKEYWADFQNYTVKTRNLETKVFCCGFVCAEPGKIVILTFKDMSEEYDLIHHLEHKSEYDELTGLMNSNTFCQKINEIYEGNPIELAGKYAIVYFDVIRFKAINDLFGKAGGDLLLIYIGEILKDMVASDEFACRVGSDRYALFIKTEGKDLTVFVEDLIEQIGEYELSMKVSCNVGIYVIDDTTLVSANMLDRAILAEASIKGTYAHQYRFYTEELRRQMLSEQEIVGSMVQALYDKQFVPYFQPQFNHSTGELVGAEALVRWVHPEKGLINPGVFIPIFEANGFITPLDMYIFECTCQFIHKCLTNGIQIVPISTNFSRYDILQSDFVEQLEEIRNRYDVPVNYIRIEITESAVFGGNEYTNEIVHKLHMCGYIVEMDDFGSGYSSLNVLKDIDFDIIKLDMKFLSDKRTHSRGGTVISSIVSMARWLNLPVIAEGVENMEQADFLTSIGADYIQGYLYSKPIDEEQFITLLGTSKIGNSEKQALKQEKRFWNFWDPKSQESVMFNNFVAGAGLLQYCDGVAELCRVNKKYIQELGIELHEKDVLNFKMSEFEDESQIKKYIQTVKKAIETNEAQICDTWRIFNRFSENEKRVCIQSNIKLIDKKDNRYLIFVLIRNITDEKLSMNDLRNSLRRSIKVCEQVNFYYWEYDVKTRDATPCPRIMKEFNLPSVIHNYPMSVIDTFKIGEDFAKTYIQWHEDIRNGKKEIVSLVREPLHNKLLQIRYETEFDENGNAIRALGSALVVEESDN